MCPRGVVSEKQLNFETCSGGPERVNGGLEACIQHVYSPNGFAAAGAAKGFAAGAAGAANGFAAGAAGANGFAAAAGKANGFAAAGAANGFAAAANGLLILIDLYICTSNPLRVPSSRIFPRRKLRETSGKQKA